MFLLEALWQNCFLGFFSLWRSHAFLSLWPHFSTCKASDVKLHPSLATIFIDSLLLPFPHFRDPCNYIGPSWKIQGNILILKSIHQHFLFHLLPSFPFAMPPNIITRSEDQEQTSFGSHHSALPHRPFFPLNLFKGLLIIIVKIVTVLWY